MKYFFLLLATCISLLTKAEYNISGHITNAPSHEMSFVVYFENKNLDGILYKTKIDKEGNYKIQLPVIQFSYIMINDSKNDPFKFLAEPGKSLKLSYDANNIKTGYKISGSGAISFHFYDRIFKNATIDSVFDSDKDEEIIAAINLLHDSELQFLSGKKEELTEIEYGIMYADLYGYTQSLKLSVLEEISGNKFESSDNYSRSEQYKVYCLQAINYITINSHPDKVLENKLNIIKVMFEGKMREALVGLLILNTRIQGISPESFFTLFSTYKSEYGDNHYLTLMDGVYNSLSQMGLNKPAIDFVFTDIKGNKVSLSNYKGKVIYLTFWASWCPVTNEIYKWLSVVKEYYKNSDSVIFLNVNFDESLEEWKKGTKEYSIGKYKNEINLSTGGSGSYHKTLRDYVIYFSVKSFIIGKDFNFYAVNPVFIVPYQGTENNTPKPGILRGSELIRSGNGPQDLISQLLEAVNK